MALPQQQEQVDVAMNHLTLAQDSLHQAFSALTTFYGRAPQDQLELCRRIVSGVETLAELRGHLRFFAKQRGLLLPREIAGSTDVVHRATLTPAQIVSALWGSSPEIYRAQRKATTRKGKR